MSRGYKTTPQNGLDGRVIDYARGKGLGGSSAVNFGVYAVGARDDYDEWAEIVGDEGFRWDEMKRRFKNLEKFDSNFGSGDDAGNIQKRKYANPLPDYYGDRGALKVGFAKEWEMDLPLVMDSLEDAGLKRNLNLNSGNPLGMVLCINSSADGIRSTAKDLLVNALANLEIVTDTPVQRVLFDGKKAVGVQTKDKKCEFDTSTLDRLLHPRILKSSSLRIERDHPMRWILGRSQNPYALRNRPSI